MLSILVSVIRTFSWPFVSTRGTLAIHSPNPLFFALEAFLLLGSKVSTVGMFQNTTWISTSEYNVNNPFLFILPLSLSLPCSRSLSFILVMAGTGFLLLALFYFFIDVIHWWNGAPFKYPGWLLSYSFEFMTLIGMWETWTQYFLWPSDYMTCYSSHDLIAWKTDSWGERANLISGVA